MPLTMYDSVTLTEIPRDAEAVAGYVNGRWPTYPKLVTLFPHAQHLSIAVNARYDADCLDVEKYDATPAQAPAWVRRQQARGIKQPVVYCSVSDALTVLSVLAAAGIKRSQIRLWTAHYTKTPHRCTAGCGFGLTTTADATQYTDTAQGRNLDASLVADTFFAAPEPTAVRRRALRTWILALRAHGVSWTSLKKTANWNLWRRLGGK